GMDVPLALPLWRLRVHRVAIEVVLDQVGGGDEAGCEVAREEEAVGPLRVARADVAEAVEDVFVRENAVGDDEVVDDDAGRPLRWLTGLPCQHLCREERRAQYAGGPVCQSHTTSRRCPIMPPWQPGCTPRAGGPSCCTRPVT